MGHIAYFRSFNFAAVEALPDSSPEERPPLNVCRLVRIHRVFAVLSNGIFSPLVPSSRKPRYSITAATVDFARISRPTFVRVARLATSFPVKYGNLSAAVASPASAVRVASFGCLPASALVMVVAKFGSLPNAAASSFSVFSASGDESTRAAIAAIT